MVISGEGWGVVIRTGDNTFIGRVFSLTLSCQHRARCSHSRVIGQIASLTGNESGKKSPLAEEIE